MRIIQLVHTLNYGDAISGEALLIREICRKQGMLSDIYCMHAHQKLTKEGLDYKQLTQRELEGSLLLLHHSIDSPLNRLFQMATSARRGIIYHNLTPSEWFLEYNGRVEQDLINGREELPELFSTADFVVADSQYNANEISKFISFKPEIVPLALDKTKWAINANQGIVNALRAHGGKNILHVGRLAPNKCIEDVIKSFYFYHHKINKQSKLWVVGIDIDTELYALELKTLCMDLGLYEVVEFVGGVADSELKAFYQESDAYLCMSEHEGFCLPLVEAMYFGIPIIAYSSSAVPETLGEAGILVEEKDYTVIGELISMVTQPGDIRESLIQKGKSRAEVYSQSTLEHTLLPILQREMQLLNQPQKIKQNLG